MIHYKGEIIKRIKRRTNKRMIEDKINKTKLPCGTKFSRDLISRIGDFVRLTGWTFRWFGFQILLLDLRQVSVRYLTFCTGTYKNSNKARHIFLTFWTWGFPWWVRKPRIGCSISSSTWTSTLPSFLLDGVNVASRMPLRISSHQTTRLHGH